MDLIFQAIVIGVIQGLTEFIPVSSSAHLELTPWILGWSQDGSSAACPSTCSSTSGPCSRSCTASAGSGCGCSARCGAPSVSGASATIATRLGWLLILASIPAALIGFALEDAIETAFHGDDDLARLAIAGFLVIGAAVLFIADRYGAKQRDLDHVGPGRALIIGLSQAAALLPGISRSGATMSTGSPSA